MLDIFKWECTINEKMPREFPLKILHFIKKQHKIAFPEKSTFPTKKNRTASVFMLE